MSRSRTSYHHGDLRAAVLRRAEETLRESGPDSLSLRQLARDVGVSHGAPSRHFPDKQALLDALALVGFDRLGAVFTDASAEGGAFPDRLRALARAYLRFAVDNPALLALMFARKHSSTADADIIAAVQRAFATPIALITEAQQHGEIIAGDSQRIGMSTAAALQGLATFSGSGFIGAETLEEMLEDTIGHLMQGLQPRH